MVNNSAPLSGGRAVLQTGKGSWGKGGKMDTPANECREHRMSQEVNGKECRQTVEECEPPSGLELCPGGP